MKLLIADDHDLVLDAVRSLLENELPDVEIELARSGTEVEKRLDAGERFDLLLLDLRMPGISGAQDVKELMKRHSDQPTAILSGMAARMEIQMLLENGARGFIPKTMPADGLVAAVRLILAGQVFSPMPADVENDAGSVSLTPREREVLFCLQRGEANKEIARSLDIQETTVKLHLRSLALKLEARNRTEVVVKAIQSGLLA
ncbi:response regulator transcription factor [Henriciella marina]|uniref:Response regulator transcription factor n=1 Tax=Henriciella marina TaxID=453851 RepID=A0ABT4LV49_9PROT|nr:response regulator transcription factor [Henriciella marina]MCZ4298186.1 response regulator transcription factor [Henriciella marina]